MEILCIEVLVHNTRSHVSKRHKDETAEPSIQRSQLYLNDMRQKWPFFEWWKFANWMEEVIYKCSFPDIRTRISMVEKQTRNLLLLCSIFQMADTGAQSWNGRGTEKRVCMRQAHLFFLFLPGKQVDCFSVTLRLR